MALARWNPLAELSNVNRDFHDLFGTRWLQPFGEGEGMESRAFAPTVDIREEDDRILLSADLPGVNKDDIDVSVEGSQLTIRAERKFEDDQNRDKYHRVERFYGVYQRSFTLPETADTENMAARYDNGVLEVTVPKRAESKRKSVKIQ